MNNICHDLFDTYIREMNDLMFIFEVTKISDYQTEECNKFVTIYKEKSLLHLYEQVMDHFQILEIKELFFYAPNGQRCKMPISKQSISQFIATNVIPVYQTTVIYKLYLVCDA